MEGDIDSCAAAVTSLFIGAVSMFIPKSTFSGKKNGGLIHAKIL